MKIVGWSWAVLLMAFGTAAAESAYENCVAQEKLLRQKAADNCSGMAYLFNPSGCFAARKAAAHYDKGVCKKLLAAEQAPQEIKNASPPVPQPASPVPQTRESAKRVITATDCEQLREENARLKMDNERFKAEIEQLRKGSVTR